MGKKYIIELEDKPFHKDGDFLCRVKGFNSLVFDMTGIGMLTPYTEPDTGAIREEAFKSGYNSACKVIDVESKTNTAYQKGLSDAWEAVKKLARMDTDTSESITGYFGFHNIMHNLTASEAIEKIRQYEQAQNTSSELTKAINDFLDNTGYALANVAEVLRKMGENNG